VIYPYSSSIFDEANYLQACKANETPTQDDLKNRMNKCKNVCQICIPPHAIA